MHPNVMKSAHDQRRSRISRPTVILADACALLLLTLGVASPATAQWDITPPTVTIAPSGTFSTNSIAVTVDWCDDVNLAHATRKILLNGVNVQGSFSHTFGTDPSCGASARSTGTITLQAGQNTLRGEIKDGAGNLGANEVTLEYNSALTAVTVTPENQSVSQPDNSTVSQTFTVLNTTTTAKTYALTRTCTGSISNCTGDNNVAVDPGQSGSVNVGYQTANGGTSGVVRLKTAAGADVDSGWVNVTSVWREWITVSMLYSNNDNQNFSLCANDCFTAVHAQSTVPYFSLDQPRAVTVVYHGDRVAVRPFVVADVSIGAGAPVIQELTLKVRRSGANLTFLNGDTLVRFSNPAAPSNPAYPLRLAGQLDLSAEATGMIAVDIIVTAKYSDHDEVRTTSTNLLIVNERSSPVARGWTIAGLQRLYPHAGGSALITEGDGSALYFSCAAICSSPAGEYSQLYVSGSGASTLYTRRYPDSSKVWFRSTGLMDSTSDAVGNKVRFTYDGSGRLTRIDDPYRTDGSGARSYVSLTYGTYGLSEIKHPGPDGSLTGGRSTLFTVASDSTLRVIKDPDGDSTRFGYDGSRRLSTVTDRRGFARTFVYATDASWKVSRIDLPEVAVDAGGGTTQNRTPSVVLNSWQRIGVPTTSTAATPAAPARSDTIRAWLMEPDSAKTLFTVDRWGQPATITDPRGRTTTFSRDGVLITQIAFPTGSMEFFQYEPVTGRLQRQILNNGRDTTSFAHDQYGFVAEISGSGTPTQQLFRQANGLVDSTKVANLTTKYRYDSRGRDSVVTDPGGHITRFRYDARFGNRDSVSLPGNRFAFKRFDRFGRDSVRDASGVSPQTLLYDDLNRVTELRDGVNASPTLVTYDAGMLLKVRDPKGQQFRSEFNALGWKTVEYDPADTVTWNRKMTFRYNVAGVRTSYTNRRGQRVDLRYDALRRLVAKSGTNVVADSFAFDSIGRIAVGWNAVSRDSVFTDSTGWTDSVVTRFATDTSKRFRLRYRKEVKGRLDSLGISTTSGITFANRRYYWNDVTGVLDSIAIGSQVIRFGRNAERLLTTTTWPGNLTRTESTTTLHSGYQASYNNATVDAAFWRNFAYDSLNRIVQEGRKSGSGQEIRDFSYDGLGRLRRLEHATSATQDCDGTLLRDDFGESCTPGTERTSYQIYGYQYDAAGNLTQDYDSTAAVATNSTFGIGNRTSTAGPYSYEFDLDGNMSRRTRSSPSSDVRYYWSSDSRLDSVTAGTVLLHYEYNAFGQLARVRRNGVVQRHLLWDRDHVFAEMSATLTARTAEYAFRPGLDEPVALVTGTQAIASTRFFHQDRLGNVLGVTSGSTVSQQLRYTPWGAMEHSSGSLADTNRIRWKGLLWEADSTQLYFMRNRWYDPVQRRFVNEDPLGLVTGPNRYVFGQGDAINARDPLGLAECELRLVPVYDLNEEGEKVYVDFVEVKVCTAGGGLLSLTFGSTTYLINLNTMTYVVGGAASLGETHPTALQQEFEINVIYDKTLLGCPPVYLGTWPSIGRVYTWELKRITSFWRSLFGTAEYQGKMTLWMPDNYGILTETRTVGGTAYCREGAGVFNESNVAFP